MTRIDSSLALAALIQQRLAARSERNAASQASGKPGSPTTDAKRPDPKGIGTSIARRIRALDGSAPERRRKAFRIFLEATLAAELGNELINDPAFYKLVDEVQESMELDRDLQPRIDTASNELLRLAGEV